jgi:hypothetical protein
MSTHVSWAAADSKVRGENSARPAPETDGLRSAPASARPHKRSEPDERRSSTPKMRTGEHELFRREARCKSLLTAVPHDVLQAQLRAKSAGDHGKVLSAQSGD